MKNFFNLESPVMVFLSRLCDLFWLNILTVICCLPVFTIGAAVTALYYTTMKMVRGEDGYLTKPYFKAFRDNFKKSTIIWLIMCVISTILFVDYYVVISMNISYRQIILVALLAISFFLFVGSLYFFPLQARFENTCGGTIKNGFLLAITQLPRTIVIVIIYAIPIILVCFSPSVLFLYVLVGIALPNYLSAIFFVQIFKKIEEAQLDDKEELPIEEV